jgi:hypothetical protein
VGSDGGRDQGVGCVGRGVEKVLPEMQRRDWWAARIKSFVGLLDFRRILGNGTFWKLASSLARIFILIRYSVYTTGAPELHDESIYPNNYIPYLVNF